MSWQRSEDGETWHPETAEHVERIVRDNYLKPAAVLDMLRQTKRPQRLTEAARGLYRWVDDEEMNP